MKRMILTALAVTGLSIAAFSGVAQAWQGDTVATGDVVCSENFEQVGTVTATYTNSPDQDAIVTVAGAGFSVGEHLTTGVPVSHVASTQAGDFVGTVHESFTVSYPPADSGSFVIETDLVFTGEGCTAPPPVEHTCEQLGTCPVPEQPPVDVSTPVTQENPQPVAEQPAPVVEQPVAAPAPELAHTGADAETLLFLVLTGMFLVGMGTIVLVALKASKS